MDVVFLEPKDISVVIPSLGKRKEELEKVLEHLKSLGFEDIIVVNEKQMLGRYLATYKAKNEVIYTQDDDLIVENIPQLIEKYNEDKVVCNIKLERMVWYNNLCEGKIALVGYGAIFNRKLVHNMNRYLESYPDDSMFEREADRIFTFLNDKELVIADGSIKDFPSAMQGMSNTGEHFASLYKVLDNLLHL